MSYKIIPALRELGKQRREMGEYARIASLRRRLRRQRTIRVWTGRIIYTACYLAVPGLSVALLLSL